MATPTSIPFSQQQQYRRSGTKVNMQLLSVLLFALAAGATPVKRVQEVGCDAEPWSSGKLTLSPNSELDQTCNMHLSFSGVRNSYGHQVLTIAVKESQYETFDFVPCNSTTLGWYNGISTSPAGSIRAGILRSHNNRKYCVRAEELSSSTPTKFTAHSCNYDDDSGQVTQFWRLTTSAEGERLEFISTSSDSSLHRVFSYNVITSDDFNGRKRLQADPSKQDGSYLSFDHS
ncbi:hypothetical protein K437DRAFT_253554 [Tilletiaria anomala UBC 951]|uniref:Ricin B lectin domain-containing protein n=1 Tax=Tilletiaria anomala (strain ATCC 24038 / CBS 436.72 / UBC 951) TaxID=1037660 RepID=A0A066WK33_TILAU|nr:uncharacterized protein K437DRAFT_253554 [Tilletiaria anomala UBC 951]KDN52923.1 hypothetical protein K437DRAFT_253554 [Tilletiaria anomala UBC 951]